MTTTVKLGSGRTIVNAYEATLFANVATAADQVAHVALAAARRAENHAERDKDGRHIPNIRLEQLATQARLFALTAQGLRP